MAFHDAHLKCSIFNWWTVKSNRIFKSRSNLLFSFCFRFVTTPLLEPVLHSWLRFDLYCCVLWDKSLQYGEKLSGYREWKSCCGEHQSESESPNSSKGSCSMITTLVLEEAQISVLRYMTSTPQRRAFPLHQCWRNFKSCSVEWQNSCGNTGNKTTSTPPRRASLVLK